VMAEEGSRGRPQPVRAVSLERKRRMRAILRLLADRDCDKRRFMTVIREDFGLPDGSVEFLRYMEVWDKFR